jgi:protein-disulfide isomerase
MNLEERKKYVQMKARHRQQLKPWYLKTWGILSLLLIAIVISFIVASAIYVVRAAKEYNQQQAYEEAKRQYLAYQQAVAGDINNQSFGNKGALLNIVQFSDFACQFCALSAETVLNLKNFYQDYIYFTHRDLPTQFNSVQLALSAHCAGEQNSYWQYYEKLFANHDRFLYLDGDELSLELTKLSHELNLDPLLFAECLDEERYLHIIANDYADSEFLKLTGTPVWFINNQPIVGHVSNDRFLFLVDSILREIIN